MGNIHSDYTKESKEDLIVDFYFQKGILLSEINLHSDAIEQYNHALAINNTRKDILWRKFESLQQLNESSASSNPTFPADFRKLRKCNSVIDVEHLTRHLGVFI